MARFGTRSAMIRYYQAEGFRIGEAKCCECHFVWVATFKPDVIAWMLECPACHKHNNWFTEYQLLNPRRGRASS